MKCTQSRFFLLFIVFIASLHLARAHVSQNTKLLREHHCEGTRKKKISNQLLLYIYHHHQQQQKATAAAAATQIIRIISISRIVLGDRFVEALLLALHFHFCLLLCVWINFNKNLSRVSIHKDSLSLTLSLHTLTKELYVFSKWW